MLAGRTKDEAGFASVLEVSSQCFTDLRGLLINFLLQCFTEDGRPILVNLRSVADVARRSIAERSANLERGVKGIVSGAVQKKKGTM